MERVPFAIVGCGGMGGRHLNGVKELYDSGLSNVELVAVCDLRRDNAEHLAANAERLLGQRPAVFTDMEAMTRALPELQAVDVTTDTGSHYAVVHAALDLGLHIQCEKPLASTIRGCNLLIEQHGRTGRVLSVAEQFRRDPICRLTRALLQAGVIGDSRMLIEVSAGGGNRIIIFPWRHIKEIGGIFVDAGVHNADLMQYYLGPVREVYARAAIMEPVRYRAPG
ncbi:MAG: Gfo/Idh/MocA family protein, partial [Anaerolineae bacterium]